MTRKYDKAWLKNLIGETETLKLEFKATDFVDKRQGKKSRSKAIAKHVSAMANAAGGKIILGLKEEMKVASEITAINELEFGKETLQQIIDHNIQPTIDGLNIERVLLSSASDSNDVGYVIEVPRSTTAHQSLPHRQYFQRRSGPTTEVMVDSEIRDVMNRGQHPKIELDFTIELNTRIHYEYPYEEIDSGDNFRILIRQPSYHKTRDYTKEPEETVYKSATLHIQAINSGKVYAKYVNVTFNVSKEIANFFKSKHDSDVLFGKVKREDAYFETTFTRDNTVRDYVSSQPDGLERQDIYGPARYDPILPGQKISWKLYLNDDLNPLKQPTSKISWAIYTDNAPPTFGEISVANIQVIETSEEDKTQY